MGTAYKVVFIDWYGTLSVSTFLGHWNSAGHPNHAKYKQFESLWLSDLEPLLVPWMRGELVSEGFVLATARLLEIDYEALMPEFIVGCERLQLISDGIADRVRAIQELGTKVVIATDNMDCFTRWTVPALGLNKLFDGILNSHHLKSLKQEANVHGHSGFFADFLDEHKISPGESVLIDDSHVLAKPMERWGIEYRKIAFGDGVMEELDEIIGSYR